MCRWFGCVFGNLFLLLELIADCEKMVCRIKVPKGIRGLDRGEYVFERFKDLRRFFEGFGGALADCWVAKCVGDDEETVKMRSFLLDAISDEVVHYRDGSFGPCIEEGI